MQQVTGGVCAPRGFSAGGIWCGIRKKNDKRDLALIVSSVPAAAAAMYTTNRVEAASIQITREHLRSGRCQAIICNSGNANACTGEAGLAAARRMAAAAAKALNLEEHLVAVASTGVIGVPLPIERVEAHITELVQKLQSNEAGHAAALEAIMTTDTRKKEVAIELVLGGVPVRIGAMAKGAGMIHPNMATMLCFITTDAAITPSLLEVALRQAVSRSFNRVSVDGDTSTNDTVLVLANGKAGNRPIDTDGPDFQLFATALEEVCITLARMIARDGEGATKLVTCTVSGAEHEEDAAALARAVISSSLVKAAMFGADANWGRILCAMGYSGVPFDPTSVRVRFASGNKEILVCEGGAAIPFSEETAKRILSQEEVQILIDLGPEASTSTDTPRDTKGGAGQRGHAATCWGCDLTYEYVKINGDYRS
ncbi:MAG TPA: bifunctional glutamate N-acetyltransferase/amino-acid acetyltransferase ArgJ [Termitinemataceae bacterium]|nr:bifunctional glutamate N-acetyltransferase/amino-acid acetyltransferase ArgJ [Termitinemataceae bacterium]HOM24522.1 bifunctional glutamate N-acetyltransferase/amino-acid acetyltransferase ArgJ [Termitinemataceae bacterium]HPQ01611.1 bifunctional glutamate N-acetyltransferase/amino-acid acetyltransferase ArgJ [Termitinemataceae bacterium]